MKVVGNTTWYVKVAENTVEEQIATEMINDEPNAAENTNLKMVVAENIIEELKAIFRHQEPSTRD